MASQVNSATRGVPVTLQDTQTSGNGAAIAVPPGFREHRVVINGSAGIASGAVQVETADDPNYAGTWQAISTPVTAVASAEVALAFEGTFKVIRARISTPVVGGTVTVTYVGD